MRALAVLRDLDRLGGIDLYELAARYGTSVRTIRRDLAALQEAGLPLVEEPEGKRKRWRVAFKSHASKLSSLLDAGHYLALRLAMEQGGALGRSSPVFASLEDLADKVETVLGPSERATLATLNAAIRSSEKLAYRAAGPDVFWPLVQAIGEHRLCRIDYRAPRPRAKDTRFEALPLRLFAHDGAVYLLCSVPKHGAIATLNLHRLRRLKVLDRRGTAPRDFDPERQENTAFGIVAEGPLTSYVLRFAPEVSGYIRERIWHPTQALRELSGGGVELRFTCAESYEVSAWVASWRGGVEVVRPPRLREELGALGRWLTERYSKRARRDFLDR